MTPQQIIDAKQVVDQVQTAIENYLELDFWAAIIDTVRWTFDPETHIFTVLKNDALGIMEDKAIFYHELF